MTLVTTKEAAKILATPEGTLRYWKCIGKGPRTFKMYGRLRYDLDELNNFIASCCEKGNYEPLEAQR